MAFNAAPQAEIIYPHGVKMQLLEFPNRSLGIVSVSRANDDRDSIIEWDTTPSTGFRKAAWKLASEIARPLGGAA